LDKDDAVLEELELIENYQEILEKKAEDDVSDADLFAERCSDCGLTEASPVHGRWTVKTVRPHRARSVGFAGDIDIRKGDLLAFHLDYEQYDESETFNLHRKSAKFGEAEYETESISINHKKRVITLHKSDFDFKYRLQGGDRLRLYPDGTDLELVLERI